MASPEEVITAATTRGLTIACAESLTGGAVCTALVSVPGSSAVVLGGVVTYTAEVKADVLGVDPQIIDTYGVVRGAAMGAWRILRCNPLNDGGFEPVPLNAGAGGALGTGTLQTVYDPAILETQIAQALSVFDANLNTQLFWGHNTQPFNNAIQAGTFVAGARFPVVFTQDTAQFATTLQKQAATGATMAITHNINYLYSNSPTNVFPSAYTTNLQLQFTQPLLGSKNHFCTFSKSCFFFPFLAEQLS